MRLLCCVGEKNERQYFMIESLFVLIGDWSRSLLIRPALAYVGTLAKTWGRNYKTFYGGN